MLICSGAWSCAPLLTLLIKTKIHILPRQSSIFYSFPRRGRSNESGNRTPIIILRQSAPIIAHLWLHGTRSRDAEKTLKGKPGVVTLWAQREGWLLNTRDYRMRYSQHSTHTIIQLHSTVFTAVRDIQQLPLRAMGGCIQREIGESFHSIKHSCDTLW